LGLRSSIKPLRKNDSGDIVLCLTILYRTVKMEVYKNGKSRDI